MKRCVVAGCPGSGKSVFSRRLGLATGLPVVHLDNLWWREDRTHVSRAEFDALLAAETGREAWIIDGDYSRTLERRIRAADTVFFLDYDEKTCLEGVLGRIGRKRPDCPFAETEPDAGLIGTVRGYREMNRPRVLGMLKRYCYKRIIVFSSRAESERYLAALAGEAKEKLE